MSDSLIQEGFQWFGKAKNSELEGNLQQALQEYTTGLQCVIKGQKNTKPTKLNKAHLEFIDRQAKQFMTRAEDIKKLLSTNNNSSSSKNDLSTNQFSQTIVKTGGAGAVQWDDIVGLGETKLILHQTVILPLRFPQLFSGKYQQPYKAILFYGVPGGGKSMLAKAVATETKSTFFALTSADLISKWVGESEKAIKNLFELARQKKPSILFIDEIDSICSNRSDGGSGSEDTSNRVKSELLIQMQGGVGKDNSGLLVLGATNAPWAIDPGFRRRFEKRIYIPLPDQDARTALFQAALEGSISPEEIKKLGELTDGYSGADLEIVIKTAHKQPLIIAQRATYFKKIPDLTKKFDFLYEPTEEPDGIAMTLNDIKNSEQFKPTPLAFEHFLVAIKETKPSVNPSDLKRFEDWTAEYGITG